MGYGLLSDNIFFMEVEMSIKTTFTRDEEIKILEMDNSALVELTLAERENIVGKIQDALQSGTGSESN